MSEISKECTGRTGVSGGIECKFKVYEDTGGIFRLRFIESDNPDFSIVTYTSTQNVSTVQQATVGGAWGIIPNEGGLTFFQTWGGYGSPYLFPCYLVGAYRNMSFVWFDGNIWNEIDVNDTGHTTEETALEVTVVYIPPKE